MNRMLYISALLCLGSGLCAVTVPGLPAAAPAWADDEHHGDWFGSHGKGFRKGSVGRDHGNETSGEIAAWLFGMANATVVLSLFCRAAVALSSRESLRAGLKRFNRSQKKWLLPLHYFLNPLAAAVAAVHYSLSSCRSTGFPDWALLGLAVLLALGLAIKLRWAPVRMRPRFFRLHTHPLFVSLAFALLVLGHQLMD